MQCSPLPNLQKPDSPRSPSLVDLLCANLILAVHLPPPPSDPSRSLSFPSARRTSPAPFQARLAARGERDPSLITYHAERRERAARCIQGYLLRQQRKEDAAPDGGVERCVYTEEQLFLIRRAQRAFRAHIKQHTKEAKAT